MAINYLNKLFENTTPANPKTVTFGQAVPAESLVIVALTASRSGATPGVVSVTDSKGHTYTVYSGTLSTSLVGVAYCRTTLPLTTSDTLTVTWNGALSLMWVSGHAFDNVSGTRYSQAGGTAVSTKPQLTVDVTGSDWLTFATFHDDDENGITPVNSSVSRDSVSYGSFIKECFSRNGTTGSTHTIGGTTGPSARWYGVAVSFEGLSSGGGNLRGQPRLVGV